MRVAIAWYGAEGQSSYRYYKEKGDDVTIVTPKFSPDFPAPEGAQVITGGDAFDHLSDFDLVVRSSGINPHSLNSNGKIWSSTNEFLDRCPAPIIGVTGTKGKGTTSSLIASIIGAAGKTVHLVGNIGTPALDILPNIRSEDVVVFEMSSFQLWDVEKSPHVAVVLMIEPDHLDVHTSLEDYYSAKANIRRYQNADDICTYHPTNVVSAQIAGSNTMSRAVRYATPEDGGAYVRDQHFFVGEQKICSVDTMQIPGGHNLENACAAITAAWSYVRDSDTIAKGLSSFSGLPHRLKLVHESRGVRYFDDSYSSAPGATIAALRAHSEPQIILLGGYDKGADFTELANTLVSSSVKKAVIYGATRHRIADALRQVGVDESNYMVVDTTDFDQIVRQAAEMAVDGDVVVLSPGCASFDMFKNFTERGETFTRIVQTL